MYWYGIFLLPSQSLSYVHLFVATWTVAYQARLNQALSRHEYWNLLPFYTPGDLLNTGIKPPSLASPALAGGFFTTVSPEKPALSVCVCVCVCV